MIPFDRVPVPSSSGTATSVEDLRIVETDESSGAQTGSGSTPGLPLDLRVGRT